MSLRRHNKKYGLNPKSIMHLPDTHPAMAENRTLFPSTVVDVTNTAPENLLVSGHNNAKIGKTVKKGKFKGYAIYMLSLEERATCPTHCEARSYCYGNSMPFARRHRISDRDIFYDRLSLELAQLCDEHEGVLVRLHVLGDFPDVEYVSFWKEALDEWENLACFGYTHCKLGNDESGDTAAAIESVKSVYPDRFRIRWSGSDGPEGAIVLDYVPEGPRAENAIVCPSQRDDTECCATCALCWESAFEAIAFIKHGKSHSEQEAEGLKEEPGALRKIVPLALGKATPATIGTTLPEFKLVRPESLLVETNYQRDLSGKSLRLIRNIVSNWDWAKFKPPIVSFEKEGRFIIDGQHTAIAAATHPAIEKIPVMVVNRAQETVRAEAFISQNTNRIAMSQLQIFHAEVAAKNMAAITILKTALLVGATIPRSPPPKGKAKPGQIIAVSAIKMAERVLSKPDLERLIGIAVKSGIYPINQLVIRPLHMILSEPYFDAVSQCTDDEIAEAMTEIGKTQARFEQAVLAYSVENECGKYRAAAMLIRDKANREAHEITG